MNADFKVVGFLKKLLDSIPAIIVVIDAELSIVFRNTEAGGLLRNPGPLKEKLGDLLDCVNSSEALGGCGKSKICETCSVRTWVTDAVAGKSMRRGRVLYERRGVGPVPILITAAPFDYEDLGLSLVVIEDVRELEELRSLLPICFGCKRIRDDADYWQSVESYIEAHMADVRFTHGICPKCAKKLYGFDPGNGGTAGQAPEGPSVPG